MVSGGAEKRSRAARNRCADRPQLALSAVTPGARAALLKQAGDLLTAGATLGTATAKGAIELFLGTRAGFDRRFDFAFAVAATQTDNHDLKCSQPDVNVNTNENDFYVA